MPATGKIPKRNKLDLIYAIGSLRTVSSLLAIPPGLTIDEVHDIIERSHRFDRSTILTAMVAKVDESGLAPNFAGVDRALLDPGLAKADCNAQDVLMALIHIGTEKLREIREFPAALQAELFTALKSGSCTLRALAILDQMQGEIVKQVRALRDTSPLARAIRQANEAALLNLYDNRDYRRLMIAHLNPKAVGFKHIYADLDQYFSQPTILYTLVKALKERVISIHYAYYLPNIYNVRLGKEYHQASVGEQVEAITPDIYRKFEGEIIQYDPQTPWGFMALIKEFGTPLLRILAEQIKADQKLREKILSEEADLQSVRNYFEAALALTNPNRTPAAKNAFSQPCRPVFVKFVEVEYPGSCVLCGSWLRSCRGGWFTGINML